MTTIIDSNVELIEGDSASRKLVIKRTQDIPSSFLDDLKHDKFATSNRPAGNWHRIASIPTGVVEKWRREGFDIHNASAKEIVRRLSSEDLGAFITTTKAI